MNDLAQKPLERITAGHKAPRVSSDQLSRWMGLLEQVDVNAWQELKTLRSEIREAWLASLTDL